MADINTPENEAMRMPEQSTQPVQPASHLNTHTGPMIGVLVIMLVLILVGLYLWGGMLKHDAATTPTPTPIVNREPETPRSQADQKIAETVSTSDEITAIDADVSSTDLTSLDSELAAVDIEFNTAETVK